MRPKKSNKIILISIIIVLILLVVLGITYVVIATDIFKSNKELFFKYTMQIGEKENGFFDTQLAQYFEKQKNTPYKNEGNFNVNITATNGQEQFKDTNNMNLTFSGQVDVANSKSAQDISLNYSDSVKFPIKYKQIGKNIGIQTQYIGSKYISIETDNSNNSQDENNSYIDETSKQIEKIQDITNIELTNEDLKHIQDTYFSVLNNNLQDQNFSKIEENNENGYKLTLTGEELKNILIKLLETLKTDQLTLDKLNEYIKTQKNSSKITASSIDNIIKDINNNSELNNENIEITVYQNQGKPNKIEIKINEFKIELTKSKTANDLQYNIELEIYDNNKTEKIYLIIKYTGLQSNQIVNENYELGLELENIKYQYNFNNNIEFTSAIGIEQFNDNNSLFLNQMETEQATNFITAIIERIQNVNKTQMEELGLMPEENPLRYLLPDIQNNIGLLNLSNEEISKEEVSTFNEKFEMYASTNLQGVTVKGLLSTIQLNNESQEINNRKIKEINFDRTRI